MKAVWCYDLRQPQERFWRATPREFHAIWKRHKEAVQQASIPVIQLAQFCSMWLNSKLPRDDQGNYARDVMVSEPSDFIPDFDKQDKPATPPTPIPPPVNLALAEARMMAFQAAVSAPTPEERVRLMAAIKEKFPDVS